MRDVTRVVRVVVLPGGHTEAMPQTTKLDEAGSEREVQSGPEQKDDHQRHPLPTERWTDFDDVLVGEVHNRL